MEFKVGGNRPDLELRTIRAINPRRWATATQQVDSVLREIASASEEQHNGAEELSRASDWVKPIAQSEFVRPLGLDKDVLAGGGTVRKALCKSQ
ncbi:hypothetical protein ACV229_36800 [Burkholderia sp. MR1-5-21]